MKKFLPIICILIFVITLIFTSNLSQTYAGRGCCSWHGGQAYCDRDTGRWVCNDGTYSPTCTCSSYELNGSEIKQDNVLTYEEYKEKYPSTNNAIQYEEKDETSDNTYLIIILILSIIWGLPILGWILNLVTSIQEKKLIKKANELAQSRGFNEWNDFENAFYEINNEKKIYSNNLKQKLNMISKKAGYLDFNDMYKELTKEKFDFQNTEINNNSIKEFDEDLEDMYSNDKEK